MKNKLIKIVKIIFLTLWVAMLCFSFLGLFIYTGFSVLSVAPGIDMTIWVECVVEYTIALIAIVVHLHDERNLNNFIFKYQVSQAWNKADVM